MDDQILKLLRNAKTIAVVGLTDDFTKPSYGVSEYMQECGYRIVPINPKLSEVLGERCYPTLTEAAGQEKIDIVNVFRRPDAVPAVVEETIALRLTALWLQEGVVHEAAAELARQAEIVVVMDKCILKEHRRLGL